MKKLISTAEAAEQLGLRPNTLEVWRCQCRGPKYKKLGSRVLYDLEDLEEFAASCTVYAKRGNSSRGLSCPRDERRK